MLEGTKIAINLYIKSYINKVPNFSIFFIQLFNKLLCALFLQYSTRNGKYSRHVETFYAWMSSIGRGTKIQSVNEWMNACRKEFIKNIFQQFCELYRCSKNWSFVRFSVLDSKWLFRADKVFVSKILWMVSKDAAIVSWAYFLIKFDNHFYAKIYLCSEIAGKL